MSDHALLPSGGQEPPEADAAEFQEHGLQRELGGFAPLGFALGAVLVAWNFWCARGATALASA
ncbi:hypothetical protein [Piscinibacter sp.]|jgi:hypothetical protein|uniref:hypothetical protein n=1 Tax=Piscinibacter sp. TaxID=1903157 RepID=UPI00355980C1